MLALELIPGRRWLDCQQLGLHYEFEPRGNCYEPISLGLAAAAGAVGSAVTAVGPVLSTIGTVAGLGGTLLSAKAGVDQANYQAAVDRRNAVVLKQKANESAAAGQRAAITQQRKTQLVQSRARALAADSGTDAASPDILKTESDIAGQGEYNALSAIYEGMARARSDNDQAEIDLFRARETQRAAPLAATGTILAGLGNLADRRARRLYPNFGG